MKEDKKSILIIICGVLCIGLFIYASYFAIKHKNDGEVLSTNKVNVSFNASGQLDVVTMPNPNQNITLKTLPETTDTLTTINYNTFKKLFMTTKKSILTIEKNNCNYCADYEPKFIEALNENNVKAYKLNISDLSNSELFKIYDFVNFTGTPTTFIIENGKVTHSFSGTTDKETLSAFIEYFYVRNE